MKDLLTFEQLFEVRKAAPRVTAVPFDVACRALKGMVDFSRAEKPSVDENGLIFWQTRVKIFMGIVASMRLSFR